MDSSEQTELTNKIETDPEIESRLIALREQGWGWKDSAKKKREGTYGPGHILQYLRQAGRQAEYLSLHQPGSHSSQALMIP